MEAGAVDFALGSLSAILSLIARSHTLASQALAVPLGQETQTVIN